MDFADAQNAYPLPTDPAQRLALASRLSSLPEDLIGSIDIDVYLEVYVDVVHQAKNLPRPRGGSLADRLVKQERRFKRLGLL